MNIFVTGIGTSIGKTVVSAVLVEALQAEYWKPVQAGNLKHSDSQKVYELTQTKIYPERYRLREPLSPHAAAKLEGLTISLDDFQAPITNKNLVIEGAGGLMSPIGDNFTNLDLMKKLGCSVILVSMNYLGSINHTLLSISVIKNNNIPLKGIIFNSDFNPESESFILKNTGIACLGRIPNIIPEPITVKKIAKEFQHILG